MYLVLGAVFHDKIPLLTRIIKHFLLMLSLPSLLLLDNPYLILVKFLGILKRLVQLRCDPGPEVLQLPIPLLRKPQEFPVLLLPL